jgi:hypothetical protein
MTPGQPHRGSRGSPSCLERNGASRDDDDDESRVEYKCQDKAKREVAVDDVLPQLIAPPWPSVRENPLESYATVQKQQECRLQGQPAGDSPKADQDGPQDDRGEG